MQETVGHIRVMRSDPEQEPYLLEVLVEIDEETGEPYHVYVVAGRRQLTDFPFGQPNESDHGLGFVAMRLITQELEIIDFVWPEDNQIIDLQAYRTEQA